LGEGVLDVGYEVGVEDGAMVFAGVVAVDFLFDGGGGISGIEGVSTFVRVVWRWKGAIGVRYGPGFGTEVDDHVGRDAGGGTTL
jgi:hypothetical protein